MKQLSFISNFSSGFLSPFGGGGGGGQLSKIVQNLPPSSPPKGAIQHFSHYFYEHWRLSVQMRNCCSFILFFLITINCYSQNTLGFQQIDINNLEPGRCYFTSLLDSAEIENQEFENAFVLDILPPQYEEFETTLFPKDIKSKLNEDGYFTYQTMKGHLIPILKESDLAGFNTINNPKAFMYCLVEVPPMSITFYEKDLKEDSITIIKKRIIEKSKIIKTYVQTKPKKLKANQLFFESGHWSKPKTVIAGGCGRTPILEIKKALINLGYDLELNNTIDEQTKKALFDFQRKNNLKEGNLDRETLKRLGIL